MRAYSQDLRDRALQALGRGESLASISRRLEVSRQWVCDVRDRMVLHGERHQVEIKSPALWHQLNRWGLSLKKNPARQRARTAGRTASAS